MQLRWLIVAIGGLLAVAFAVFFGLWLLLRYEARQPRSVDRPHSVVTDAIAGNEPLLQPVERHDQSPREDLDELRRKEDRLFESLGWKADGRTHAFLPPEDIVRRVADAAAAVARPAASTRPIETPDHRTAITPVQGSDEGAAR